MSGVVREFGFAIESDLLLRIGAKASFESQWYQF
jgi:hypothetical protein